MILAAKCKTTTRYTKLNNRCGGRVRAISVTLSKIPLAARENRPWTVVSGNERGLEGGKVAGEGSQPEPYVRGLSSVSYLFVWVWDLLHLCFDPG
jgi:hypothetical protein